MWDQDGVHEIYRGWRQVLEAYGTPDRILCAEAWVSRRSALVRYVRPDEMHQAFNFDFLDAPLGRAAACAPSSSSSLRSSDDSVGAPTTWVLSNHDVVRHASRLGCAPGAPRPNGIRADDPQPDAALGLRRARAATALMLALPGGAYVYQGEELGLPEHTDMPDRVPPGPDVPPHRTATSHRPRRLPGADPVGQGRAALGFGPGDTPVAAAARRLRRPRRRPAGGRGRLDPRAVPHAARAPPPAPRSGTAASPGTRWRPTTVIALRNTAGDGERTLLVVANLGADPVALPAGEVLVASGPLTDDGAVPTDTTVWVRLPVA